MFIAKQGIVLIGTIFVRMELECRVQRRTFSTPRINEQNQILAKKKDKKNTKNQKMAKEGKNSK